MFRSVLIDASPVQSVLLAVMLLLTGTAGVAATVFESEKGVLRYVPADTPYLIATGRPLPDKMLDKIEPKIDRVLQAYQMAVREVVHAEFAADQGTLAVAEQMIELLSVQAMRDAGYARDSQLVLYGHGLLPVLRVGLGSPRAFEKTIERLEESAEQAFDSAEIAGQSYRYIGDENLRLVIAGINGDAVFTLVPAALPDAVLRMVLGVDTPDENIAASAQLSQIAKQYQFTDHYIGFIDVERIVSAVLEPSAGSGAALFGAMEDRQPDVSAVCKREIYELAGIAPRLVFGYDEVTADRAAASAIVEMREDIAAGLTTIAALVPGLGRDTGGLFSFGMSFNLLALREFYTGRLDAMEADPFECEYFEDLQAGVAKGRAALNQPVPPFVYGLRGFKAVFDDIVGMDLANNQPPESVDASVVIAMENAAAMLEMGAMLSPELAELNLQADGVPVQLELPALQEIADTSFAAMTEGALAVSVGSDAKTRVTDVLYANPTEPPPVFGMTMDAGSYYEFIGDAMMLNVPEADSEGAEEDESDDIELSPKAQAALRDAMVALGSLYDRMSMNMRFTARGIEIDTLVTLKD